jgi:hypothetical protein
MVTRSRRGGVLTAIVVSVALLPGSAQTPGAFGGPAPVFASDAAPLRATLGAARTPLVTRKGIREARAYAARRAGNVAFAVADERGRIRGRSVSEAFESASVSKAMLLVATLRAAHGRPLSVDEKTLLRPMITESDNKAASAVYARIGGAAVSRVAARAKMTHFREVGYWSDEQITPADQVRLFFRLDALVPKRHRAYARSLLGGVVPGQRWGMPGVAQRRGLKILFKGGWRTSLTHQVARLERGRRHVAIAVMTTGAPSMAYSEATIAGIAARVLKRPS